MDFDCPELDWKEENLLGIAPTGTPVLDGITKNSVRVYERGPL